MKNSFKELQDFRVVGPVGATGIIVASMVGSGIFSLTGQFGAKLGTSENILAAWVIGGVLALCGGLSLAELGAMIPCSGGSVEFARRAFGGTIGYLVAMVSIFCGYFLSLAVIGLLLGEYVNQLLPTPVPIGWIASLAIIAAFVSQIFGLHAGYRFNTALSLVKFGFVALFVFAGLFWPITSRMAAPALTETVTHPSMISAAVASATLTVSFAYLGWAAGADIAGDMKRPGRNVPLSIITAIVLVFAIYIGVNIVYLRVIDPAAMLDADGTPMQAIGGVAARLLFGTAVGNAMAAVIALLFFSTMVSGIITGARIIESMAHSREIPAWIGVRLANGVPMRALIEAFVNTRFEPAGMTDDPDIRMASSIVDYLFRRLAVEYLTADERAELGVFTREERMQPTLPGVEESITVNTQGTDVFADPKTIPSANDLVAQIDSGAFSAPPSHAAKKPAATGMICSSCGSANMQRAGACYVCGDCGSSSGCS